MPRPTCVQASAAKVPQEEATHPGEFPGIYACDVRKLLDIYELTARARLAALDGDLGKAQARDFNGCWAAKAVVRCRCTSF